MAPRRPPRRAAQLVTKPQVRRQLVDIFAEVQEGFQDQRERSDNTMDNWDIYNCKLTDKQFYNGQSQIFMPYVADAVDARKTRFTNQIFPQSGRYVDVITGDAEPPDAMIALIETYVRRAKLKTDIMPALMVNGDVEGQYSLYVGWTEERRRTTRREQVASTQVNGIEFPELGMHYEFVEEDQTLGRPTVEVIADSDVLILPVTSNSVEDAIAADGSVTVMRRWTKGRIRKAVNDGDIDQDRADILIKNMQKAAGRSENRDTAKRLADAAGIRDNGSHCVIYETWTNLKVDGSWYLCVTFYGGDDLILGVRRCPYWCDLPPLLSKPVKKLGDVVKGKPPVDRVASMQYSANDTINEGADTAHFSAMPIVMTNPEKNPKIGTMVLGLAAVWETSPQDTQFAQFPELWVSAMNRAEGIKSQIMQSLGVNPAMMPSSTGGDNKRNQAEVANEQAVDLLTTADAVGVVEEGILTPLIQRFLEYDHQFRDEAVTVSVYGPMGQKANMQRVEPIQLNKRYELVWLGVEAARNAAQVQQQIAGLNIFKGIPPQMYQGYRLNLQPMLTSLALQLFGPRLAPQTFERIEAITIDPMIENQMLEHGFIVTVYPDDNDQEHLAAHMGALQEIGGVDPHGTFRDHIAKHQEQLQMKMQAQTMAAMGQGQDAQGVPGGPGGMGQPGVAGTPAGAQPGQQRMKGPPGMIHQDQMPAAGAVEMPRKM